ncbi:hypothetical protein [Demequina iriomotensis]|uniref:hypothetical protein n=1 Tax=Demequina iriomotensis TaxID=1536641 RepID=UPI000AFD7BF6|nr:hypothetical protein [Demequina iriomotensis]
MTSEVNTPDAAPAFALLRRWEAASIGSVWRRPGDWFTPAAEALAEALDGRLDTAPAAYRLGFARAEAGVGITEAIDDMAVLFRSAGYEAAPIRSIRSLCEGWTEGDAAQRIGPVMNDPESGLGTQDYLVVRLGEIYGAAERSGASVGSQYALVLVDVASAHTDPWQRMARNAAIGQSLRDAYGKGHPMARLADGLYAVLVERGPDMGRGVAELRDRISRRATQMRVGNLMRQPPRVWIESLPDVHAYAVDLLDSLHR